MKKSTTLQWTDDKFIDFVNTLLTDDNHITVILWVNHMDDKIEIFKYHMQMSSREDENQYMQPVLINHNQKHAWVTVFLV